MKPTRVIALVMPLLLPALVWAGPEQPAIPPEPDTAKLGACLHRTMALLEAGDQGDPRPIRILFYGQSIVAQGRLQSTFIAEVRKRFPKANIVPTTNAIGGYQAPRLLRTMVHDIVPFRPDLIVFDDYGGETDGTYEQIIHFIRSRTTAELLTWSPHLDNFGAKIDAEREATAAFRRQIAAKYGSEFADVRAVWGEYLEQNKLPRTALLQDQIHNNTTGCELLARILVRHLVKNAEAPPDKAVRTIDLTDTSKWADAGVKVSGQWKTSSDGQGIELRGPNATLDLEFTGTRVDLIGPADAAGGSAHLLIDGKVPSAVPETWVASRPSAAPIGWFPAIDRVTLGKTPVARETWTAHFFDMAKDGKSFKFRLTGSATGEDGEGVSGADFVSKSGLIQLAAADFTFAQTAKVMRKEFPAEFDVTWRTSPLGLDEYQRKPGDAKSGADDKTLLNGLPNGPHHLTLAPDGSGPVSIRAFVVHQPQFAD